VVKTLAAQQRELKQELEQTRARQEEVTAAFDPKALDAAVRQETELKTEQANRTGKRDTLQRQVAGIETEIETLVAAETALAAERQRLTQHQALLAHAQFLRDIIRQAGPYVIRRLVTSSAAWSNRCHCRPPISSLPLWRTTPLACSGPRSTGL
jgi:chromosome segregation ATPase